MPFTPEAEPPPFDTEYSLLWGGTTVGDAMVISPYKTFLFNLYLTIMARQALPRKYGVLHNNHASYSGDLAASNPAGTTLRIASGAALNLRILYLNDANVDFDCSNEGYYLVSVRTAYNTQTSRLYLTGPVHYGYPTPVRGEYLNDLVIALVYSDGATLTITDIRRFFRNIFAPSHHGGSVEWYTPGIARNRLGMMMECGSFEPEVVGAPAHTTALFPRAYSAFGGAGGPILFFQPVGGAVDPDGTKIVARNINPTYIDYDLDATGNLAAIWFMSFGRYA